MGLNWLVRAALWVRNPPSMGRVILVLAVVGFCLALAGYEALFGWPEWLTVEPMRRGAGGF